ncbi:hypothetical protein E2C01_074481 [Portunus trituberculatus]|uniref:Uncharacterized protein n=1 Tax=Portunus trituberculatus TaxID=210409 RepID=A0A5B7IHD0_PORTR|nr:hypothetical protein [Portunus trituberculatus]
MRKEICEVGSWLQLLLILLVPSLPVATLVIVSASAAGRTIAPGVLTLTKLVKLRLWSTLRLNGYQKYIDVIGIKASPSIAE